MRVNMMQGSTTLPVRSRTFPTQSRAVERPIKRARTTDSYPASSESRKNVAMHSGPTHSNIVTSSSDDDEDPDFGREAKDVVKRETEEAVEKEERRRYKDLKTECKKKGLPPPPKPSTHKKSRSKSKIDHVPLMFDDDEAKQRKVRASTKNKATKRNRSSRNRSSDESSDDNRLVPTKSTFDPDRKRRELYRKVGIKLKSGARAISSSDSEGSMSEDDRPHQRLPRSKEPTAATEAEIRAHLQRRWVNKEHPERMSLYRKRMEECFNPLIKLLNIDIVVTNAGDGSDDDKDQRIVVQTDDENSEEEATRCKPTLQRPLALPLQTMPPARIDLKAQPDLVDLSETEAEPTTEEEDESLSLCTVAMKAEASTQRIKSEANDTEVDPDTDDGDSDMATLTQIKSDPDAATVVQKAVKSEADDESDDSQFDRLLARDLKRRREQQEDESRRALARKAEAVRQQAQAQMKARQEARQMFVDNGQEASEDSPALEPNECKLSKPRGCRPRFRYQDEAQALRGPHPLRAANGSIGEHEIPTPVNRFLREYQREGVDFLYSQYSKGMGGILGDDMGLGKTIQVIAFLSAVMTSVIHNWEREFRTWSYLEVGVFDGHNKASVLTQFNQGFLDVVIAGFETTRFKIDELASQNFTIVITDEAHRVKNPRSSTTKALHLFPTKLRYGLTGTAIQNRLDEFWCILNWACPGKVGSGRQWSDLVSMPLKVMQSAKATDEELAIGRARALALVGELLPNFWLRRTKDDPKVKLQLPPKIDHVVLCPMTKEQVDVYQRLLQLEEVQILLTASDPCPCGATDSRDKRDIATNREKYEQDLSWAKAAFPENYDARRRNGLTSLDTTLCGKWTVLAEMLDLWIKNGDKVLIFTLSLRIIELLEELFTFTPEFKYKVLDGSVPNDERMKLVDQFNDERGDISVFILSTRAGGVGLNLTAANRVVIFDPNWNPAHDLQAMDRSYRFGQTREVHVYRFVAAGSIEELIINRQQYKRAMAGVGYDANAERRLYEGVEGDTTRKGELYGVKNIFKLTENYSITTKAIQNYEMAEKEARLSMEPGEDGDDDEKNIRPTAPARRAKAIEELREHDGQELLHDLTGLGDVEEESQSPQEKVKRAKLRAEQQRIADILGVAGSTLVNSDATLGSSTVEEARAKDLFRKGVGMQRANREHETHESGQSGRKGVSRSKGGLEASTARPWDPTKRKRKIRLPTSNGGQRTVSTSSRPSHDTAQDEEVAQVDRDMSSKPSHTVLSRINAQALATIYKTVRQAKGIPADLTVEDHLRGARSRWREPMDMMNALLKMPSDQQRKEAFERLCDQYFANQRHIAVSGGD
ncbi:hypothetical protein OIO90_003878 [Microbotryomycetes sp. JL221]|nr:hypothetical protein OIO90_003878 [Microbotryomycetes sp. JL221]